ncbi:MAG: ATP-binding protein [Desulfitobacteriaceae bacterium]
MKFLQLKLRTKIALFSFSLVLLSVLFAGVVIVERTTAAAEKEIGSRAMAIARTVAELRDVQVNLEQTDGAKVIQPIAERIRQATGVEYIVIFDMDRIRYSHPIQDRIGTVFNDGDEAPALRKQEYLSQAVGVIGPSIRAFVPVMTDEGTRQVGVVAVGILVPTISEALRSLRFQLYSSLLVGVILGILGSFYLARNIKKNMFSLEPQEIARILEERIAIFQAMGEGVIAIDRSGKITIWNNEARRLAGVPFVEEDKQLEETGILPGLRETIRIGVAQFKRELVMNETIILADFLPVKIKDQCIGAATIFRDKTEVHKMAEELTGVKTFIEALRVQNHESLNKLHTIAGLIQLGKGQDAIDYIFKVTEEQEEVTRFLSKHIRNTSVAGLLLGKYNRAKELKVDLFFDPDSDMEELPSGIETNNLVIVLGNLLENALEAASEQMIREVYCLLKQEKDELVLSIEDTGSGIPEENRAGIFQWGFTTKDKGKRGIGLYLVKQAVDSAHGAIDIESGNWGTRFLVSIPIQATGR